MVVADRSAVVVGVIFQGREVALILGGDALRQFAFGQRIEHLHRDRRVPLATFSHSELIAVPTLRTKSALAFEIRRAWVKSPATAALHDAAYCRLKLGRHLLHRRFAFGSSAHLGLLLLRLHFLNAQKIFLECLSRSRVFADLIATRRVWISTALLPLGELVQDRSYLANRLLDRSPDP